MFQIYFDAFCSTFWLRRIKQLPVLPLIWCWTIGGIYLYKCRDILPLHSHPMWIQWLLNRIETPRIGHSRGIGHPEFHNMDVAFQQDTARSLHIHLDTMGPSEKSTVFEQPLPCLFQETPKSSVSITRNVQQVAHHVVLRHSVFLSTGCSEDLWQWFTVERW